MGFFCSSSSFILIWCLNFVVMEEQFILRVPPSVAERIERLLNEDASSSEEKALDLCFTGEKLGMSFQLGNFNHVI